MVLQLVDWRILDQKCTNKSLENCTIGRAFASVSGEEMLRVSELFDLTYVRSSAKNCPSKYPPLVGVENCHGVELGNTYTTKHKYNDSFNQQIAVSLRRLCKFLRQARMSFSWPQGCCWCFCCCVKATLEQAFTDLGVTELEERMIYLCINGAVVNFWARWGVVWLCCFVRVFLESLQFTV